MQVITESAEHHFLTMVDKVRPSPGSWQVLHFQLTGPDFHADAVSDLTVTSNKLEAARFRSENFASQLGEKSSQLAGAYLYIFSDSNVLLFAQGSSDQDKKRISEIYREMSEKNPDFCSHLKLAHEFYHVQKIIDQQMLSMKRFQAYRAMTDANKISSLPVRRSRRESVQVLIVEDDRFTASYTSNMLGKDYEVVVCRSGEEGLLSYIENAPDAVLLDVHLPGMSGHDTLLAMSAADPEAYVVMLSVDTVRESVIRASQTGARSFLKKPFTKDRLLAVIKNSPHVRGYPAEKSQGL